MDSQNRYGWAAWVLLGAIALTLRVGVVFWLWSPDRAVWTYEHGEIAENLLAGRGFSVTFLGHDGPTSQQAPLYPVLLATAYRLFGVASPAAMLAVQLLQCAAGALLAVIVVRLGHLILPDRRAIGWIAGCGAAVYPPHVYMVTHIQVAVWAALLLTLLMAIALDPQMRGRLRTAVTAGLVSGLLLLVEPIMVLALPVVAIVLCRGGRRWAGATVFLVMTLAVISPWLVRNAVVHGEFVFVKSTFGYACWQGNNPASWGTDKIPKPTVGPIARQHDDSPASVDRALWDARHETIYIDDVLLKPEGYRQFAGLSEPERSRLLGREALAFIHDSPWRYARLCWRRLGYFLMFDETNPKAAHPIYRTATVVWLATAGVGLVLLGRYWRAVWPTVAVFAAVAIFHALTIVSARFRIPVEPLTFLWCATGVHQAARVVHRRLARADIPQSVMSPSGNSRRAA